MRLLKLDGADELSFVEFSRVDIPPYAILSHTWGSEEVIFKDIANKTGKGKAGHDKIRFCGEQSARDGYQYFWVDTCCIDKSNNTELTESINSMFRWYQNAAKCYVLLADVSSPNSDADAQANQSTWEVSFRRSKWFTRGWTLQELIAPTSVEFFSLQHKRLGDKKSLEKQIHEITGIPTQALRGNPFSSFKVDERMEWAIKRQTTKEEDEAYCLLGICEVSMPLVYGEGKVRALYRLRKEVIESSKHINGPKPREGTASIFQFDLY